MKKRSSKGFSIVEVMIVLFVLGLIGGVGWYIFQKQSTTTTKDTKSNSVIDISNPPKFIQADFIDSSKIFSISKFRSGEGHDFSGNGETCRSMKHYFTPQIDTSIKPEKAADGRTIPPKPDGVHDIGIFSPVDGTIVDITQERFPVGEQIYIRPSSAKDYTIRLFHIYKVDGIKQGTAVKAGQKIGVISGYSATDIAIEAGKEQYVSYFQVMPDNIFATYQERGATSRDDFIISKEYRDAHPIPCNQDNQGDQSFNYPSNYDHDADDVHLSGYVKPDYSQGQHNLN